MSSAPIAIRCGASSAKAAAARELLAARDAGTAVCGHAVDSLIGRLLSRDEQQSNSDSDLVPVIAELLGAMETPDEDLLRSLVRGDGVLVPSFGFVDEKQRPAALTDLMWIHIASFLTDERLCLVLG